MLIIPPSTARLTLDYSLPPLTPPSVYNLPCYMPTITLTHCSDLYVRGALTPDDMYSPLLKTAATGAHALTAILCTGVWVRTVKPTATGHYVPRIIRGLTGSLWSLPPKAASDDPEAPSARDGRAEYALLVGLFTWFAVLPVVSPFPLATVPSILGKRMSRAASGWTFLAAVVSYVLKDAAERGRSAASTFVTLRTGLAIGTGRLARGDGGVRGSSYALWQSSYGIGVTVRMVQGRVAVRLSLCRRRRRRRLGRA